MEALELELEGARGDFKVAVLLPCALQCVLLAIVGRFPCCYIVACISLLLLTPEESSERCEKLILSPSTIEPG